MKALAAVTRKRGEPYSVEPLEILPPGPRDVIVRTGAASYCITDNLNNGGKLGKQDNTVFGHSAVGMVEEVGSQVTSVKVGDRVACGGTPECGVCHNCARARPDQCERLFEFALPLGTAEDGTEILTCPVGGYAELMRIPEFWAFPIETELPDESLCMLGCGITSALGAIFNVAEVNPGATVAILGAGQLGLWMTQGAKVAGAERVIVVEPRADRREIAAQLGATDLVDPDDGDPVELVKELTAGRGADFSFEAAGSVAAMEQAVRMTLNTGIVVPTGVETLTSDVTISALEFAIRGRDIRNCQNGRCRYRRDLPRFIGLIEDGHLDPAPILSGTYPLAQINDVAAMSTAAEVLTAAIVPSASS